MTARETAFVIRLLNRFGCVRWPVMAADGVATHRSSYPRMRVSSTPQLLDSIAGVSGILDHPHARAMTTEEDGANEVSCTQFLLPAACFARALQIVSPKKEGAGNAGCTLHPRSRVQSCAKKRTRAYRFSGGNPAFPAQWLYGLCRDLPGDEFVLSPSSTNWRLCETRLGLQ